MVKRNWRVYLSGEIHSNWRDKIIKAVKRAKLPIIFYSPVTNHEASDDCGVRILGDEAKKLWKDRKSAGINAIRTRTLIEEADVVVVRFGDKYKEWNAAFDAGYAVALGTPIIVVHHGDHIHALKEVDAAAVAVCERVEQVVAIFKYVTKQK